MDGQTDNLIKVFNAKDEAAGGKITAIMAQMDGNEDINVRHDCVLSCLSIYLSEDLDTLVKEYMAAEDLRQSVKLKPDVKRRAVNGEREG